MRELVEKKWVMNSRKESERGRQTHEYDTVCNFMVKREKKTGEQSITVHSDRNRQKRGTGRQTNEYDTACDSQVFSALGSDWVKGVTLLLGEQWWISLFFL